MIVTQIAPITGSRSKIYIDDEFAFVLYKGELRHYKIIEGGTISEEIIDEIVGTVLAKRAKLRGMALLKNRPYTKKQMRDKLKQGFYSDKIIAETIEYLESFHYIDDVQYAVDYITYHNEDKSRIRLEQDLQKKGIEKEIIREAFDKWKYEGGFIDEEQQIKEWIRKKNYDVTTADLKEKQRIMNFLFRKGFSVENINRALKFEEFF